MRKRRPNSEKPGFKSQESLPPRPIAYSLSPVTCHLSPVTYPRAFGLTGGIASGKSTVAQMFRELGAKIIDADRIGHDLLLPGTSPYREIVERFGAEVLDKTGTIDRKRLGELVFKDRNRLQQLNALLHPLILERVGETAMRYSIESPDAVVLVEAALIYEAGLADWFRRIVVAWCRPQQQIERLIAQTGLSREAAAQRVASQMPNDEKRRLADYVIDCSGTLEESQEQVASIFKELQKQICS